MRRALFLVASLLFASLAWSQRILTTPDFTSFAGHDGQGTPQLSFQPMPDGGTLVYGNFDVWYQGARFRDVMRLKPGGEPDTAWKVLGTVDSTGVTEASLTPSSVLLLINKNLWIAPLDGSRAMTQVTMPVTGIVYGLSNYDKSFKSVYAMQATASFGPSLVRVDATSGQANPFWAGQSPEGAIAPSPLIVDSAGGLWSGHGESSFMLTYYSAYRYSLAALAANPTGVAHTTQSYGCDTACRLVAATNNFVYVGLRRFLSDGTADGSWFTRYRPLLVNDGFVYVKKYDGLSDYPVLGITRLDATGNNSGPGWEFLLPSGFGAAGSYLAWPTPGEPGNVGVLGRMATVDNVLQPLSLVVKEDLTDMTAPTVVEYYVPALKRYFITGRKNEQDTLDALPQSFTRTGMKFAAKSSRYRDIAEQPVCRLYASPEKGLSNSHFYGIGTDCPTLNKLSGLKYEGYDFSVLKPTSSGCTADAPNAVTRLFNNRAASNDSNHRYVVSAATKARMLAQGWIDEGAVFCSASVTDAVNY